jgi:hypothetical protein
MQVSMTGFEPGLKLGDKGIFAGTHELTDRSGHYVGRFNIFAARTDLNVNASGAKTLMTFKNTAIELGKRGRWLGHYGYQFDFEHYEQDLFKGLRDGTAVGEWFIPTSEMLGGWNADEREFWPENLYDLRNTGDFNETLTTASGAGNAGWYWSCTEHRDDSGNVLIVRFSDGGVSWVPKERPHLGCRPCRAELAI